jgi:hypothetical protein
MTNTEYAAKKGQWTVGPIAGDGGIWLANDKGGERFARVVGTHEDLASLRDALTEYLAPPPPTTPAARYLAVLFISPSPGAQGYTNVGVTIPNGTPTLKDIRDIERNASEKNGWPAVVLTALIPLGGAQ